MVSDNRMPNRMQVDELIQGVATQLGWPVLQADTAGRYALAFENDVTLEIFAAPDNPEQIIFQGLVSAKLPIEEPQANTLLGQILESNFSQLQTQTAVLSLTPPQDQLILWRRLTPTEQSTPQQFSLALESFLNCLDYWIQLVKLKIAALEGTSTPMQQSTIPIPSRFSGLGLGEG